MLADGAFRTAWATDLADENTPRKTRFKIETWRVYIHLRKLLFRLHLSQKNSRKSVRSLQGPDLFVMILRISSVPFAFVC